MQLEELRGVKQVVLDGKNHDIHSLVGKSVNIGSEL